MSQQAKVTSLSALREFRAMLVVYQSAVRDACEMLLHEGRRGVRWIEEDRTAFWPDQVRRRDNALLAAKESLSQAEMRHMGEGPATCHVERKILQQAKQRLDDARDKVGAARGWLTKIAKDSDEFETRIRQLADYAEVELPKAIATMDRIIEALEQYAAGMAPKPAVGEVAGVTTGPKKEFKLP